MAAHFVNIDYDTPLILPPNLRDWLPAGHLAHFILDAVEEMDLRHIKINDRGTGSPQYPPRMLLALLLYCYATGVFSSRRIEQASSDSVPVRMICADTHPDHDTICTFRRENKALLQETFVRVLELAQALKFLQVGQITVAVDGTKVMANASKHSAVSYEHAGKTIEQLDWEVKELLAKAEQADSTPLQDGLSIPEEITRRQERKAALQKARAEIEARAQARYALDLAEHEEKLAERAAKKERGERVGGKPPQAPTPEPGPGDQYNFTDPESRIMKAGSGQHFEQELQRASGRRSGQPLDRRRAGEPGPQRQTRTGAHRGRRGRAGGIHRGRLDGQRLLQRSGRARRGTNAGRPAHRDDGLCGGGKEGASSQGERFGEEGGTGVARPGSRVGRGDETPVENG